MKALVMINAGWHYVETRLAPKVLCGSIVSHVNIGFGQNISILDLTRLVIKILGYTGKIEINSSKPDGTPRKPLYANLIRGLRWIMKIDLRT